ncbi:mannose-6-phosphate isomerase, class I, partial [Arthrobacter deserti]|nr:mannose-6-phosphate isomerase, class I [Arthrobacter deserti]
MYRITGCRRSYDWGSTSSMFGFLGEEPDGQPFAELWFGAHPTGPATVRHGDGAVQGLDEVIAADPGGTLSPRVHEAFGRLPFLHKLLAPARPLSMQVHPTPDQAREGFAREEAGGIPLAAAERNYKDTHHKPEMVYAVTRFEGLVGFRHPDDALLLLAEIRRGKTGRAARALPAAPGGEGLQAALEVLLELTEPETNEIVAECRRICAEGSRSGTVREACGTVAGLSEFYPGDVGAGISLLLHRVALGPGESVFLGDGIPHAYLSGFGLELMANSDNVLRLGLTTKHIDTAAMLESLDFGTHGFAVERPQEEGPASALRPPVSEFALTIAHPGPGNPAPVPLRGNGPSIVICLEGQVRAASEAAPDG